jgi:hypothetical protein
MFWYIACPLFEGVRAILTIVSVPLSIVLTKLNSTAWYCDRFVVQKVALDLVGHHVLDCLLDAMYDHSISCLYRRVELRIFCILIVLRSHVDPYKILAYRKHLTTQLLYLSVSRSVWYV